MGRGDDHPGEERHDETTGRVRSLAGHRQPGPVWRGDAAPGGREREPRGGLAGRPRHDPGAGGPASGGHLVRDHRGDDPRSQCRRRLCRGHLLDAHVLAGPDVDRGPAGAPQARAAPPYPVQSRSPVGRDRHGLHEPQPGRPRGPRVRVHRDAHADGPQDRGRPLGGPERRGQDRRLGPGSLRLARGASPARRPLRRQHAPCRRDRGRQGRGPDPPRRLRQRVRGERACRARAGRVRVGRGRARGRVRRRVRRRARAAARRVAPRRPPRGRADRSRPSGDSSTPAGSARSPTRSRISTASSSCRASPSSA